MLSPSLSVLISEEACFLAFTLANSSKAKATTMGAGLLRDIDPASEYSHMRVHFERQGRIDGKACS